jgi:hypothetical protein
MRVLLFDGVGEVRSEIDNCQGQTLDAAQGVLDALQATQLGSGHSLRRIRVTVDSETEKACDSRGKHLLSERLLKQDPLLVWSQLHSVYCTSRKEHPQKEHPQWLERGQLY